MRAPDDLRDPWLVAGMIVAVLMILSVWWDVWRLH
jgi:hypothetical protein